MALSCSFTALAQTTEEPALFPELTGFVAVKPANQTDENIEAKKHMLDSYPNLKAMYNAEDDNTEVLFFVNMTANFSSFILFFIPDFIP